MTAEITIESESKNSYERLHVSRNGTGSNFATDKLEVHMPAHPLITGPPAMGKLADTESTLGLLQVYSKSSNGRHDQELAYAGSHKR